MPLTLDQCQVTRRAPGTTLVEGNGVKVDKAPNLEPCLSETKHRSRNPRFKKSLTNKWMTLQIDGA